jgi:hypothetical protein
VFRRFIPLAVAGSAAVGGIVWAITGDIVGFVTGFVVTFLGAIGLAWEWTPFARSRQVRDGDIDATDAWPERRSATSTTEPLVAWFRRRGRR